MTTTTLDPTTALILVDLQKGILSYAAALPVGDVLWRAGALAAAFRRHRLPVVLVDVDGAAPGRVEQARAASRAPGWNELAPELDPQPGDHRVTKRTWGAFTGTHLDEQLRSLGVTQVVIGGVSTSIGVESTARQAHELGYNVTLATDAMLDPSPDAHANSVARIFPRLGETGSTREIVELLEATRAPRSPAGA